MKETKLSKAARRKRVREGLWTLREAAEYLRFSAEVIRRKCRSGSLPHLRIFGRLRFRRHEIEAWLDREREEQDAA